MAIAHYERRVLAYLSDLVFCLAVAMLTWWFIPGIHPFPWVVQIILIEVLAGVYYLLFAGIVLRWTNGYTVGGAIFRVKVVHMDERDITYRTAFLRSVMLSIIPWVAVNAVYMLIVHTERTIFDKMTDTIVIDRR